MTTVREFFLSESGEYVAGLRTAVDQGGEVDAAELLRLARGLRGSAQMAREERIQRLASALEAAGKALLHGTLRWEPGVRELAGRTLDAIAALAADSEPDTGDRVRELAAAWQDLGVAAPQPAAAAPADQARQVREFRAWAGREANSILQELNTALAALPVDPADREPLKTVMRRQRALLGAAHLEAVGGMADVLRSIDEVTRLVARLNAPVIGDWFEFYRLARDVLAAAVPQLQRQEEPPETAGLAGLRQLRDQIVARHGAAAAPAAPGATESPASADLEQLFRPEAAGLLARIERMAGELAAAAPHRQADVRRELRIALAAVRDTARTFGFPEAAGAAERALERAGVGGALEVLTVVADLRDIIGGGDEAQASKEETVTDAPEQAALESPEARLAEPVVAHPRTAAPAGSSASDSRAAVPGRVVPIDDLVYSGEHALRRALEFQVDLEEALAGDAESLGKLSEVFDLIRLGLR
jgi:chemotaxis protein histidine kinase CheA